MKEYSSLILMRPENVTGSVLSWFPATLRNAREINEPIESGREVNTLSFKMLSKKKMKWRIGEYETVLQGFQIRRSQQRAKATCCCSDHWDCNEKIKDKNERLNSVVKSLKFPTQSAFVSCKEDKNLSGVKYRK